MEAECKEYTPKLLHDGKTTVYYENGQVKEQSVFADNKKNGEFKSYYENGKVMEDITYAHGTAHYNHIFSPDGTDYLVNGTGTAPRSPDASKPTSFTEYLHHVPVGSYLIANSDTTYLVVEKQSEYPGGLQQLGRHIGERMKYPTSARRTANQGTVFVSFTILKNGDVVNPEVVKGFHPDCDAEALRVVKTLTPWIPAEHHNKKVNAKFVLPLTFRLK
jgi:TonB family protein